MNAKTNYHKKTVKSNALVKCNLSKVHNLFGGLGWDRDGGRCKSTISSHHTINEMGQTDQTMSD